MDGVCLTVAALDAQGVHFDVMAETLRLTTLGGFSAGDWVNVERSARVGDEIGGHPVSGHVDTTAVLVGIDQPENNHVLRFQVDPSWMKYIFSKGFLSINGCSLTVVAADRERGTFEVWLIPETLRLTTFSDKKVGDRVNIEVERQTQVMVDTLSELLRDPEFRKQLGLVSGN
jgi:riboflavin synthase